LIQVKTNAQPGGKASDNDMATSLIAKARDYKLSADALKSESAYSPPGMAVKTVSDTNQC